MQLPGLPHDAHKRPPEDRGHRGQEGRGARRHRGGRRQRGPAGAAQRHLRGNRRGAAAPADRPETAGCGEKGMSGKMRILTSLVVIAIVVVVSGVWIIRGPGPLDFAGGPKVALADYRAGKPTGVPAKLEKASLVERGEYLAKAADCMVCHTKPGE